LGHEIHSETRVLSRPLMTTQEVADLLKVKEATVRKWIRDGELPAIHLHREWRIAVRHLEEFVAARLTTDGNGQPSREDADADP